MHRLTQRYIELVREYNAGVCEYGVGLNLAYLSGFTEACRIYGDSTFAGEMLMAADRDTMEIYGDVPMTGGKLHAPAKPLAEVK